MSYRYFNVMKVIFVLISTLLLYNFIQAMFVSIDSKDFDEMCISRRSSPLPTSSTSIISKENVLTCRRVNRHRAAIKAARGNERKSEDEIGAFESLDNFTLLMHVTLLRSTIGMAHAMLKRLRECQYSVSAAEGDRKREKRDTAPSRRIHYFTHNDLIISRSRVWIAIVILP